MKKLFVALFVALVAIIFVATPALAWGESDVSVECSDIEVSNDSPLVGQTVYYSGTVAINASSVAGGFGSYACASSDAWYVIYDPNGVIVAQDYLSVTDWDAGLFGADADASQVFDWSVAVTMGLLGEYLALQGGTADAMYFTIFPPSYGSDSDSCTVEKAVRTHKAVSLPKHPVLIIETADGRGVYFPSDGWSRSVITKDISFSDGTWQLDITAGTVLQMDGKWHKRSWIIVDDQGGMTFKYGNAERVSDEIGLSIPIELTKVS